MRLINSDGQVADVDLGPGANLNDNRFTVNLGGNTLIVMLLLALVIGANCLVMGMNLAKQDMQAQYTRDMATKFQIMTNHVDELDKNLARERADAHK